MKFSRLAEKHEREFYIVNVSLSIAAILMGALLSTVVIAGIRNRINKLVEVLGKVTQSIFQDGKIPDLDLKFDSSDEFAPLEKNISRMIEGFSADVNRREKLTRQLQVLATTDKLTGAYNQMKWDQDIHSEIKRVERTDHRFR